MKTWTGKIRLMFCCVPLERWSCAKQDMSELILMSYCTRQLCEIHTHTRRVSGVFTQQERLLTGGGYLRILSILIHTSHAFSFRPNTGTRVWMRWKERLQIKKERSSTGSLGSGMKQFSVETPHLLYASGEQVWVICSYCKYNQLFYKPTLLMSNALHVVCV